MEIRKRIVYICVSIVLSVFLGYGLVSHYSHKAHHEKGLLVAEPKSISGRLNLSGEMETQESEAVSDISSLKNTAKNPPYDESNSECVSAFRKFLLFSLKWAL